MNAVAALRHSKLKLDSAVFNVTPPALSRVVFTFNLQSTSQEPGDTTGFSRVVLQLLPK